MKYIKTFESHKNKKVNEEFIGNLFKNLKNSLSLGFSKMFGKANEAKKVMDEYKNEIDKINKTRIQALQDYAKYVAENKDKVDKNELNRLKSNYSKIDTNFSKQLEVLKQKFDLKFNEIIKTEKNPKISNFINLKKLEMQQEILANELTSVIEETGISQDDLQNNPELAKIIQSTKNRLNKANENAKEEAKNLKKLANQESFIITDKNEIEKLKSENGWMDSPFVKGNQKLEKGDTIEYYSTTAEKFLTNEIVEVGPEVVIVKNNEDKAIKINKSRIKSKNKAE